MYVKLEQKDLSEIKKSATHTCSFCFINIGLQLFSDHEESIQILKGIYTNFITEYLPQEHVTCYILNRNEAHKGQCVVIDDILFRLSGGGAFDWAEMLIFQRIMEGIDTHLLLHAGVVSKNGYAYIVYAPSGFGKTTLVLELVSRGYNFLSDEFCPVNLSDFSITPFPRRVGLKNNSPFYSRINKEKAFFLEHEGKLFVDCNDIFPEKIGTDCKAKFLILLSEELHNGFDTNTEENFYELLLYNENQNLIKDLSYYNGINIVNKYSTGFCFGYRLQISKNKWLIKAFQDIWKKYEKDIFCVGRVVDSKPDFTQTPAIKPMVKSNAVFEILIQLLNRSHTSKLMQRFGGKTLPALLEVGNFLKDVDCYKMRPGNLHKMADIIDNL